MSNFPKPLRLWLAWSYLGAPPQGQRKPLFYECLDGRALSERGDFEVATFLVKALDDTVPMAREVVGNRIASLAGLQTPEPAIVLLPRKMATSIDEIRRQAGVFSRQHPGLVSGARQFNASNVMALSEVPERLQDDALRLYIFDMLALHSDRVERNPNCAVTSGGLMVYDFEQCFAEEPRFVPSGAPHWSVATSSLGAMHMFYTGLRGAKAIRGTAQEVLRVLSDERLEACLVGLPRKWLPEGRRIVAHVRSVRSHADEFVDDIERSLSK